MLAVARVVEISCRLLSDSSWDEIDEMPLIATANLRLTASPHCRTFCHLFQRMDTSTGWESRWQAGGHTNNAVFNYLSASRQRTEHQLYLPVGNEDSVRLHLPLEFFFVVAVAAFEEVAACAGSLLLQTSTMNKAKQLIVVQFAAACSIMRIRKTRTIRGWDGTLFVSPTVLKIKHLVCQVRSFLPPHF